jgi:hypothetical protein
LKFITQIQTTTNSSQRRFDEFCLYLLVSFLILAACQQVLADNTTPDQMLNPFEDIEKVTFPSGPASAAILTNPPPNFTGSPPQQIPQPPAASPAPKEPHNVMSELLSEMKADEQQGFLKYQQAIYSAHVENLRKQIAVLQTSLAERQKEHDELSSAGCGEVTTMRVLMANRLYLESRSPSLLAAMLSGNMNASGAHAVINGVSPCANPQHPYFEVARLTLQLVSLNKRLGNSLISLQQIGQTP